MATDKQIIVRLENLEKKIEKLSEQFQLERQLQFLKHHIDFPNLDPLTKEYIKLDEKFGKRKSETSTTTVKVNLPQKPLPNQDHYIGYMPRLDKYIGGITVQVGNGPVKSFLVSKDCHIVCEESYPNSNRSMHKGEFSITIRPVVEDKVFKSAYLRIYRLTSGTICPQTDGINDHLEVKQWFRDIKDIIDKMFNGNPVDQNVYGSYTNVFKWLNIMLEDNKASFYITDEVFDGGIFHPMHQYESVVVDGEIEVEVIEK